ncbi:hypothetical protein Dsin_024788 [Dipteronia sinensis]|uniref:Uncharacterized protein n=1 Tax=Dipteronia sinensis TaxID=43782 RepID=A0AAD9ZW11_9ROSI|nr:hypothetical protein Dsin_024788 [Dipteronia sinensis]
MESAKNNYSIPRPERVSLWKIEPALATPALNPLPTPRPNRPKGREQTCCPLPLIPLFLPGKHEDEKIDVVSGSRRYGSENWVPSGRHEPTYTYLLSGFGANADSSHGYSPSFVDQSLPSARKSLLDQDGKFSLLARPWSLMPSSLSLKLAESNMKVPGQSGDVTYHDLSFKSALGRSVDLSKLNNYDEFAELFEFGGELMVPKKNWLIVCTDDMMLFGDT